MSKDLFFQQRANELMDIVDGVERGSRSALITYAEMKRFADIAAKAVKQIEDLAIDEAINFGEKDFETNGYKFQIRNGATRYSYKHIPEWAEAQTKVKDVEERYKASYLARQKGLLTATQDGEELVYPEITRSKDSLIVK